MWLDSCRSWQRAFLGCFVFWYFWCSWLQAEKYPRLLCEGWNRWWLEQDGRRIKNRFLCIPLNRVELQILGNEICASAKCCELVKMSPLSLLERECVLAILWERSLLWQSERLCGALPDLLDYQSLWGEMEQVYKGLLISISRQALQ